MTYIDAIYFIISYLAGSIPFGLIIGKKFKKMDIRDHGSGNLGATNAVRVLGAKLGVTVGLLDAFKGGIIVLLASTLLSSYLNIHPLVFGVIAVFGHIYPIFAQFKGGKAVATSCGIILFYSPLPALIGLTAFGLILIITRYVSISSTLALFVGLLASIFINGDNYDIPLIAVVAVLNIFVIIKHIPNYKRLLNGTENKVIFKKKKSSEN